MEPGTLIFGIIIVLIFAYRRNRREKVTNLTTSEEDSDSVSTLDEYFRNIDWDTFDGDPKLHQAYYMANGYDMDSSFYEVRQYEADFYHPEAVREEWRYPWVPGLDREFALVLTGDFSREQYSRFWQTIFTLDCNHHLPSVHAIVSTWPYGIYCFICRRLSVVVKTVTRKEIFPTEEDSIKTREDWVREAEFVRKRGID